MAEVRFRTSRSGGPGGQNVNKTETKVELLFDVRGSPSLAEPIRERIVKALGARLAADGTLRVVSSVHRSQLANKKAAISRFQALLAGALKPRKRRVATRPSKASAARRMDKKRQHGAAKRLRRPPADG
jgi:ribosome-associated protein